MKSTSPSQSGSLFPASVEVDSDVHNVGEDLTSVTLALTVTTVNLVHESTYSALVVYFQQEKKRRRPRKRKMSH